jgi:hypothetical protein
MAQFEQRIVAKFLFTKSDRSEAIHPRLEATSSVTVRSLTQVKEWVGRFKTATPLVRTILTQADRIRTWRSLSSIS